MVHEIFLSDLVFRGHEALHARSSLRARKLPGREVKRSSKEMGSYPAHRLQMI